MPQAHSYWRADRPAEGFYTTELPADPAALTVRTFLPDGYEPRYPYPLLVLFHPAGGNEEQVLAMAPKMSRRNFVAISFRGPTVVGETDDGRPACSWDGTDPDQIADDVIRAVEQTRRTYHVHSERIYLVGVQEGSEPAYRAAFALGDRVAGVASLNGSIPRPNGRPLFRMEAVRGRRAFIGHGIANPDVPHDTAVRDRQLLYTAGMNAKLVTYPAANKLHPDMLRDLNRWVIGHVNAQHDLYVRKGRKKR